MSQRDELLLIACVHVDRLWDGWDDDALVFDTSGGIFADTYRVHEVAHAELRRQVTAAGRDPDLVKVLPGIAPVIGGTEAEARTLAAELEELIVPEYALAQLSGMLGIDLTGLPRPASSYAAPTLVPA
ncbi:hypothetical protein [Micromonospora sp. DT63]|uniref:hypothetical protein n=1 Tax=Micromonospora sp. DT63 TaxID=3393441 RepID=UPI003CF9E928